jgi:hypothetical protein
MTDEKPQDDHMAKMRARRVSQLARAQRIDAVYRLLVGGSKTSAILQAVAVAQRREAENRAAARANGEAEPPYVWGDDGPPSDRQVAYYIAQAREQFATEGRELTHAGAQLIGLQAARLNDLYARAIAEKRYSVCERIIRLSAELFGLFGAVRVQLNLSDERTPQADADLPETGMTEEQMQNAWASIVLTAVKRLREQRGPIDPSMS